MKSAKQLCILLLLVVVVCHVSAKHGSQKKLSKSKTPTAKQVAPPSGTGVCDGVVRGACVNNLQLVISVCPDPVSIFCSYGVSTQYMPCTCVNDENIKTSYCKKNGVGGCEGHQKRVVESCTGGEMGYNKDCQNSVEYTCMGGYTTAYVGCPEHGVDDCDNGIKIESGVKCDDVMAVTVPSIDTDLPSGGLDGGPEGVQAPPDTQSVGSGSL